MQSQLQKGELREGKAEIDESVSLSFSADTDKNCLFELKSICNFY